MLPLIESITKEYLCSFLNGIINGASSISDVPFYIRDTHHIASTWIKCIIKVDAESIVVMDMASFSNHYSNLANIIKTILIAASISESEIAGELSELFNNCINCENILNELFTQEEVVLHPRLAITAYIKEFITTCHSRGHSIMGTYEIGLTRHVELEKELIVDFTCKMKKIGSIHICKPDYESPVQLKVISVLDSVTPLPEKPSVDTILEALFNSYLISSQYRMKRHYHYYPLCGKIVSNLTSYVQNSL